MVLYIVRHADALPLGGSVSRDPDRPLSPRGEQEAALMGDMLARLDGNIGLILSSPLLRAVQTVEILQKSLGGIIPTRISNHLSPGFRPKALVGELHGVRTLPSMLVVGHQPDLGNLIAFLISRSSSASIAMPPGAIARIVFESANLQDGATLHWLMTPQVARAVHHPNGRTHP